MKKKNMLIMLGMAVLIISGGLLSGCGTMHGNKEIFDTTYSYERAILQLPNGEIIEGEVQSWNDYENSDQIQVKIDDKHYLVHSVNIVLISE